MNAGILRSREVTAFSEAVERIHAETDLDAFSERVFPVLDALLPGTFHTMDDFTLSTGESRNACTRSGPDGWVERLRELVPTEHPGYFLIASGGTEPMRVSDLISQRELRRTHLYHEIFKPLDGGHQIVLPLVTPGHVAAFTINRDAPFTDAELCLARLLGPHLALAHIHAQHLTALKAARQQNLVPADDGTRFGLTARETEVLRWIRAGQAR